MIEMKHPSGCLAWVGEHQIEQCLEEGYKHIKAKDDKPDEDKGDAKAKKTTKAK